MSDKIQRDVSAPADAGARKTNRQNDEKGFQATTKLTQSLQSVLVDLLELAMQGKQAHWNVVGHNFRDLHLQLDEIVEAARTFSDEVAERLRALHAVVDGRSDTVAATTSLPEFPNGELETTDVIDLMTIRLDTTVSRMRKVYPAVDAEDPTSSDILNDIIARLEQLSWMVGAENRVPAGKKR